MNQAGDNEPLVSVVTITYQHAPFIERNVQGVSDQRTKFRVEHLIGEDESTDGTREICMRLADEHPGTVRLFLRSRKDVMYIMGRPTGRANQLALYAAARGKYIAVCPGDDHWIDPDKLQRQVELMESRPELSACFTNAWEERGGQRIDYLRAWLGGKVPGGDVGLKDIIAHNFIPAVTFLFRRDLLYPLPEAFQTSPIGDRILVTHMATKGPIGYIDMHSGVREVHAGGIISSKGLVHKQKVNIAVLREIRNMVPAELRPEVDRQLSLQCREAFRSCIDRGLLTEAASFYHELRSIPGERTTLRERMRAHLLLHWPRTARAIARIRS